MLRLELATLLFSLLAMLATRAQAAEPIDLSPRIDVNSVARISVELTAGGHNLVRVESEEKGKTEQRLPMSVSAKLEYHERRLAPSLPPAANGALLGVRHYDLAEAVLKVDNSGRTPRITDDRRLIALESSSERPILYCPDGPLSREQLDLIDVVGNSLLLDQLLPTKPVAKGATWAIDASVMGPLLTFDSLAVCEVQSVLEEFNANFAKVRLAGSVHGMADGAASQQEIRGVYLFDRQLQRIARLNLAIRETRSIGGATPGLDAVAKLQIKVEPVAIVPQLSDEVTAKASRNRRDSLRDLVYEAAPLGFRIHHDRQWFITGEERESVTLRRVDRGDLVAQCTLTALPPKSAGRQISLEQFQKDVTFSLGKSFGELVSSRRWQNAAGHYCYELVVRGLVEGVPVEWHHYLVAPEGGHRVSVAVTIEKPMVDRVAHTDRQLVESLELFPRMPAAKTAGQIRTGLRR